MPNGDDVRNLGDLRKEVAVLTLQLQCANRRNLHLEEDLDHSRKEVERVRREAAAEVERVRREAAAEISQHKERYEQLEKDLCADVAQFQSVRVIAAEPSQQAGFEEESKEGDTGSSSDFTKVIKQSADFDDQSQAASVAASADACLAHVPCDPTAKLEEPPAPSVELAKTKDLQELFSQVLGPMKGKGVHQEHSWCRDDQALVDMEEREARESGVDSRNIETFGHDLVSSCSSGPQPVALTVRGCADSVVKNIVRGTFCPFSANHCRPVYKSNDYKSNAGNIEVMLYFWDERDGPSLSGWWLSPVVGGDQVWAYNGDRGMTPPRSGWRVPHDGPVDPTFEIIVHAGVAKGCGKQYRQQFGQQEEHHSDLGRFSYVKGKGGQQLRVKGRAHGKSRAHAAT